MSDENRVSDVDFSCDMCEHRDLLCSATSMVTDLKVDYVNTLQSYEMQRVLVYDEATRGTSVDLAAIKVEIIGCVAMTEIKIIQIDLLTEAIKSIDCTQQQSYNCPKVDAILDFKIDTP